MFFGWIGFADFLAGERVQTFPKTGSQVGRFYLERLLGSGGMGMVFLARDSLLESRVALKFLHPRLVESSHFERFKREVLLARKLSHPGICRLHDLHREGDYHFISMEYVQGHTLQWLINQSGGVAPATAGQLMLALCRAVAAAHKHDVIHRDLKPQNIIVRGGNRISVLDFGLSKDLRVRGITESGLRIGTACFMSPEVLGGEAATKQSDVYSLGVVFYECLTGRLPFEGSDYMGLKFAIENAPPVPPSEYNSEVVPEFEAVVLKAMAADPTQRYRRVSALKDALVQALGHISGTDEVEESVPWDRDVEQTVRSLMQAPETSRILEYRTRHTTILFSDIVGITPYFEAYGDVAGVQKIQTHNNLLFPVIQVQRGLVIKTIGDAIMSCFQTADEALVAAIEMLRVLQEYNGSVVDPERRIHVRIGLHSGPSIFQGGDVFGDAVNVAARISALAAGGAILLSAETRGDLTLDQQPIAFFGTHTLKGKRSPVDLFTVHWRQPGGEATLVDAVLPDPSQVSELITTGTSTAERTIVDGANDQSSVGKNTLGERTIVEPTGDSVSGSSRMLLVAGIGGVVLLAVLFFVLSGNEDSENASPELATELSPEAADMVTKQGPVVPFVDAAAHSGVDASAGGATHKAAVESQEIPDRGGPKWRKPVDQDRTAPRRKKRQAFTRLHGQLVSKMRSRGVLAADSGLLQQEFLAMAAYQKSGRYEKATGAVQSALSVLAHVRIDRPFVEAKLLRFNDRYDRQRNLAGDKKLAALAEKIMDAYEAGNYRQTNLLLNQAFQLLVK